MECGERKWAEPGTEVAAVVTVSCAAWEGGELGLSTSSLEAVGGGHPGSCTVPCPAGCLGQGLEGKQQSQPGKTRRWPEYMDITHMCFPWACEQAKFGFGFLKSPSANPKFMPSASQLSLSCSWDF